jgi:hypothetical protein
MAQGSGWRSVDAVPAVAPADAPTDERPPSVTEQPEPTPEPAPKPAPAPRAATVSRPRPEAVLGEGARLRRTQARIVYLFLFIFAATIAAGFTGLAIGWADESGMKDFLVMFVPAETALLGAATGFYFASPAAPETPETGGGAVRGPQSSP